MTAKSPAGGFRFRDPEPKTNSREFFRGGGSMLFEAWAEADEEIRRNLETIFKNDLDFQMSDS